MAKKNTRINDNYTFTASDFKAKAITVGSVNVAGVSGITDFGKSRDFTAYVNTTVTEGSATINAVLDSVVASAGNTLAIVTTRPIVITGATVANTVPTEVMTTIANPSGEYTASGTLSLVTAVSTYRALSLSVDVSAGGYTLSDIGSGILSAAGLPVSGTIAANGDWTIDFTNQEILTDGTVINGDYQVSYLWKETSTPIVIRHTVSSNAAINGTASAVLSANAADINGVATFTSATFTLSTDATPNDNPWNGRGALPGETTLETTGRFTDEGVI